MVKELTNLIYTSLLHTKKYNLSLYRIFTGREMRHILKTVGGQLLVQKSVTVISLPLSDSSSILKPMSSTHRFSSVDYSKWDLIVSRVADGKCGVCGKILPSSFATVQAVTKHTAELVNLTFCVPCMNT